MKNIMFFSVLLTSFVFIYSFYNKLYSKGVEDDVKVDKILILKSERKLFLLSNEKKIKEYTIDLGFEPKGHKEKEGDGKTPEGIYKISGRNPKSKYYLSLRVSYPNEEDVKKAKELNVSPGGDIMIHGLPNGMGNKYLKHFLKKDWTLGCIALQSNEEMKEIWDMVKNGTEIEIKP